MSNRPCGLKFWVGAWWPVVVGIGVIVLESTPAFGADHTTGPLRWLFQEIFGPVSNAQWEPIHHLIRKTGHFVGYGLLGLAWLRAWWITLPRSVFLQDALLAFLGTAMTASADEFHQSFLPNRTGTPWDVLLDCCGALAMQLFVYLVMRIFRPKKLHRGATAAAGSF
jgi:VanZ family protein